MFKQTETKLRAYAEELLNAGATDSADEWPERCENAWPLYRDEARALHEREEGNKETYMAEAAQIFEEVKRAARVVATAADL